MIESIEIEDRPSGRRVLEFIVDGDRHSVDEEAIATYGELLGISDMVDAVEAILQIRTGTGVVMLDPRTGEHAMTSAFVALEHREKARVAEAKRAIAEGTRNDPRSPKLRAALAARKALMEPVGASTDSESLLEIVRGKARGVMNCLVPSNPSVAGRVKPMTCSGDSCEDEGHTLPPEDRTKIREVLESRVDAVNWWRDQFLRDLSGEPEEDPLMEPKPDPAEPEEPTVPDALSLEGLVHRYGGLS